MFKTWICVSVLALASACSTPEPPSRADVSVPSSEDFACLQEAIYFEAGNSPAIGQQAVAHVILNRVEDPRFPNTVCGVVSEGEEQGRCQFSYRCQLDTSNIRWPENMRKAVATAKAILVDKVADPTGGALFFHANWMPPGWFNTLKRVGDFGGNIFYRG